MKGYAWVGRWAAFWHRTTIFGVQFRLALCNLLPQPRLLLYSSRSSLCVVFPNSTHTMDASELRYRQKLRLRLYLRKFQAHAKLQAQADQLNFQAQADHDYQFCACENTAQEHLASDCSPW
mmetsp:Transcript_70239/g.139117  ORF Transcript_70239/g.139117 Transcript_70239/m.139117 type:complete len:121 (-) Transcript_70239:17-379(-)